MELVKLFNETIVNKLDVGNLSSHTVKNGADEDIFEFEYFSELYKLVTFWKMMRLDNEPTPTNVGHFQAVRDIKRKFLFGDEAHPGALLNNMMQSDDEREIEKGRYIVAIGKYAQLVGKFGGKENSVFEIIAETICEKLGTDLDMFKRSRGSYMKPPQEMDERTKKLVGISKLTKVGMQRYYAQLTGKSEPFDDLT